jgi:hypothetical protein
MSIVDAIAARQPGSPRLHLLIHHAAVAGLGQSAPIDLVSHDDDPVGRVALGQLWSLAKHPTGTHVDGGDICAGRHDEDLAEHRRG